MDGLAMGNANYCLTKADLADAIYAAVPVDKQKAAQIVEEFIEIIKDALRNELKVMISGFGCFLVKSKRARKGRNPQTGSSMILRARRVVKFKPSQILRDAINSDGKSLATAKDLGDEEFADD